LELPHTFSRTLPGLRWPEPRHSSSGPLSALTVGHRRRPTATRRGPRPSTDTGRCPFLSDWPTAAEEPIEVDSNWRPQL